MDTELPYSQVEAVDDLRATFADWDIQVESGQLVAVHRHEWFDARRERWIASTTVRAATVEQMQIRLTIQQAVRRAETR